MNRGTHHCLRGAFPLESGLDGVMTPSGDVSASPGPSPSATGMRGQLHGKQRAAAEGAEATPRGPEAGSTDEGGSKTDCRWDRIQDRAMVEVVQAEGAQGALDPMWFITRNRPSARAVREQLEAMCRRQKPCSLQKAQRKMRSAVDKVRAAGLEWAENEEGTKGYDYAHMIEDGQASSAWRDRLGEGEEPPPPFLTGGRVGENPRFSLSAMREGIKLQQQGRLRIDSSVAPEQRDTSPAPCTVPAICSFIDEMRPADAADEDPEWVARLLDGELMEAAGFWD